MDPQYVPPQYPSGTTDPYKDGPDSGPIQKWALPTDPNAFKWVRGVGCVIMVPGTNPTDHDWTNPKKYLIIPFKDCTDWAAANKVKLPEYENDTGLPESYTNQNNPAVPVAWPQPIYNYTVPYTTKAKWSCDAASKSCLQNVPPTSASGYATLAECESVCGSFSCVNKKCTRTNKPGDPFKTMQACIDSGCGKWACTPGVQGKCELSDKGTFLDQASCEASVQCLGLNTTKDSQCFLSGGKCAAIPGYNSKTCALYAGPPLYVNQCFSTTGTQCTEDSQCTLENGGKYKSKTGNAYWCQYIDTFRGSDMSCANPANQCKVDSDCSFSLSGCISNTKASAKCAWTGYLQLCTCSRPPPH